MSETINFTDIQKNAEHNYSNKQQNTFYLILTLLCKFNENSCKNIVFCPIFVPDRRGKFESIFIPENVKKKP